MKTQSMSHNACYFCTHIAVPLCFNNKRHYLGFTSTACSDVTALKYSFYEHKGLFWYSIVLEEGHVINSLFFVDLSSCVRDFRCLCDTMCWTLSDSSGLSDFVALFLKNRSTWRS